MFTDPISDMLTRIRNGAAAHKTDVLMPYSKLKHNLANILAREGYIAGVEVIEGSLKQLSVKIKYTSNGEAVVSSIQRVSKPGQRIYVPMDRIPRTNGGLGVTILSTSKGLMTDKEARKQKYGGEVICQIW
ncbi:MAG: 30S ribosomal protein S8 [Candidatus Doudnabacteria bacterium Gr01-1014_77]|uniref:Small ribosomal subunit protein uS8 n=1 Tax=Candidatus Doudnabacteria bacterium Gr01-1014_77 TaxID=2017133 RepID=A0A554J971_9BACT|nr:MAG: 30S ribosomal protein S8 [Candidatus Doudnabacteria bacterium Gr01-1014_77]